MQSLSALLKGATMLNYAMVFLVCGIIVWALYWAGVPGIPLQVSWILSAAGIILLMIYVVTGQKARSSS